MDCNDLQSIKHDDLSVFDEKLHVALFCILINLMKVGAKTLSALLHKCMQDSRPVSLKYPTHACKSIPDQTFPFVLSSIQSCT
jgi:hypothetical protein